MSNVVFSFVIPHRNSPDLLMRCISSIPRREDIEIIVVDDNSDDDKKPQIERENFKVINLIANESKGAGHARNVGLSQVTGKWVLFIDADDSYTTHISELLDKFGNTDTNVIYFGYAQIKEKKSEIVLPQRNEMSDEQQFVLKFGFTVPWNKMVKREFIENHGIHFEECPVGNDIFYSYQVGYYAGDIFEVFNKPIYNYYINSGSIVHKKKNTEQYYVTICNHVYQCNAFWRFMGRKRKNKNLFVKFAALWKKKGFFQFLFALRVYIKHYRSIKSNRFKYVNCFKN